jgi:hypothetical protein
MFGVPANLDLSQLIGDYLTAIQLGQFDLQFKFGSGISICVQGDWQLRKASSELIDQAVDPPASREFYRVHRLLDKTVTNFTVDPPRSFTLYFDDGFSLTVFDSSQQFESFQIWPRGIVV